MNEIKDLGQEKKYLFKVLSEHLPERYDAGDSRKIPKKLFDRLAKVVGIEDGEIAIAGHCGLIFIRPSDK